MKFLLVAVNAKYIHSNLGVYSLKAYARQRLEGKNRRGKEDFLPSAVSPASLDQAVGEMEKQTGNQTEHPVEIEIGEYTINHQMDLVLKDIYNRHPDAIGFSCYIWNIEYVRELVRDIHKVLPDCEIWLGGPEVSYDAGAVLEKEPAVTGIMRGEGEETFARLMELYVNQPTCAGQKALFDIAGLAFRDQQGKIVENPIQPVMDLSRIPFSYGDLTGYEHKIIYYESSRGCPFSCSYCLSSIDKSVRFRDLELVKKELDFFLNHQVPQVKFVDRTFNCKKSHAMAIWQYLLDHDNGITNFHFEISADLLDEEELSLIQKMRPGLIQLEIGVQTTNLDTLWEIKRTTDLKKLARVVERVNQFGNVHQHLDLIAGLPWEDYESFKRSFNDVYAMRPEQLQLGFLKVLKGSYMEEMADEYGLIYKDKPPYEVLSTRWLTYGEILKLKDVEEMVEVYYNSGQFRTTMVLLEQEFHGPYAMYRELAKEYERQGLFDRSHNRLARYEILYQFIKDRFPDRLEPYRDSLMYDLYLRENVKSRPSFARDQSGCKTVVRDFFIREAEHSRYLTGYESYDSKQMSKMAHVEEMGDGSLILFDYLNRDPLNYNAKAVKINIMLTEGSEIR